MFYTAKKRLSLKVLILLIPFLFAHCGMGEPEQSSKEGIKLYATDPASHKFSAALDPVSEAIGAANTSVQCALSGLNSSSIESALAGRASSGIPVTIYADRDSVEKDTTVTATASRYKGFERLINTNGFSHNVDSTLSGTKTIIFGNKGDGRMSYNFCLIDNAQVIVSTAALDEDELLLEPAAVLIFGSGEEGIAVDFKRELNMLSEGSFGAAKNRTDLATKYAVRDQIIGLFWGQHEDPVEEIAADILRAKKSVEFYSSSLKQTSTTASKDIVTALKTVYSSGVSVEARFSTAAREEADNLIQDIVDAGITTTYLTSEALGGTQIFIIDRGETDQRVLLYSGSLHSRGNSSDDSLLLSLKGKTSVNTYFSLLNKINDSVNGDPIVISTLPEKDSTIASYRKTVSLTFDKVMDASTFSDSVLTAYGESSHDITDIHFTGLDATGRTAFFYVPFSAGEIVTITLDDVVQSATGKTMDQPYSFKVTTINKGIAYLQFTEIEADGSGDDWVEIRADSAGLLSGSKLQLYNSSGDLTEYTFPGTTTNVAENNYLIVHTQETGSDTATNYYLPADIQTSITSTDAVLVLLDPDGYMMDFVAYADGAPATSHPALVDAARLQAAWLTNGAGAVQADFVNSAKDNSTNVTLSRHKNTDYQDTNTHIDWVAAAVSKGSDNGATTAEAFSLVSAHSVSSTKMEINFSHAPLRYLAETAANYSISPSLTVHGATLNGSKVTLTTDAQTSSTEYTVTVNNTTRFGDAASLTTNTKTFTGYIDPGAPATIVINEVSPNVGSSPYDWIELYVVASGNTNGFILKEGTSTLLTFPSANVTAGDYILVHLKANGSEVNETISKTQSSDYGSSATAWDFYSSDNSLTKTDNVISLLSPDASIADALVFADYSGSFSASSTEANNAIAAGVWSKDAGSFAETDGAWSAEVSSTKSIMRKSDNYTAGSKKRYNWFVATATPGATNNSNDFAKATVSSAVAPSSTSLTVTFSRNVGSITLADFSVTGGSGLTLSNPAISTNTVTFETTSQTGGQAYTLNYADTSMVDPYGEPLAASSSTDFVGYLDPASAVISEIFMEANSGDACELTITAAGSLSNFTLELKDSLKYTFPSTVGFSTGDVIVVHWQATGTDEKTGNATQSSDTGSTNGYDFWFETNTTITATDAELTLKNNTGTVLDYAAWSNGDFGSNQSTRVTDHVSSSHWTDGGDGLTVEDLIDSRLDDSSNKCFIRKNGGTENGTHTDTDSYTDWSANTCNLGNNQAAP